mmetsp:Transcript_25803/g.62324  ORF Transcript_25803/g.62324 Transcript_25803/m.62324 type:complete len:213 (+) Transcript_25803:454-1092(+)
MPAAQSSCAATFKRLAYVMSRAAVSMATKRHPYTYNARILSPARKSVLTCGRKHVHAPPIRNKKLSRTWRVPCPKLARRAPCVDAPTIIPTPMHTKTGMLICRITVTLTSASVAEATASRQTRPAAPMKKQHAPASIACFAHQQAIRSRSLSAWLNSRENLSWRASSDDLSTRREACALAWRTTSTAAEPGDLTSANEPRAGGGGSACSTSG